MMQLGYFSVTAGFGKLLRVKKNMHQIVRFGDQFGPPLLGKNTIKYYKSNPER